MEEVVIMAWCRDELFKRDMSAEVDAKFLNGLRLGSCCALWRPPWDRPNSHRSRVFIAQVNFEEFEF